MYAVTMNGVRLGQPQRDACTAPIDPGSRSAPGLAGDLSFDELRAEQFDCQLAAFQTFAGRVHGTG